MLLLTPLLAACTPRGGLPKMFSNLHLRQRVRRLLPFLDPFVTIDISSRPDYSLDRIKSSDAYEEVKAYLSAACSRDARELHADGAAEGDGFVLSLREGQEVADEFRGVTMWWSSVPPSNKDRDHCLRLTFLQRHRGLVVNEYLPHLRRSGRDVMFGNRRRRLYTNKKGIDYVKKVWSYIDFDHPTTFDTLAMQPEKKRRIMDDLDDFRNNKEYYARIGKAWKRGYLLYGPPGTGKSTMIAAMANYLNYDIYDIELTMVQNNNDLRKLFIETKGKSIIVIEDIDCSLDLTGQRSGSAAAAGFTLPAHAAAALDDKKRKRTSEVTLSGLLNFIDGIWSAHSGERIIVFTTNFLDKLDPALVRRGRMDMHVEMSYCGFEAFTTLAKNYLGVDAHPLFDTVKELLQAVEITPADVAECLMMSKRTERGADVCLGHLIDELKKRAEEKESDKDKAAEEPPADANAAAAADAKTIGRGGVAKGRRVIDPGAIRRLKKVVMEVEGDDDKAAAKAPNGNDFAVDNGGTEAAARVNGVTIDLSDDSSSDNDYTAKGAETEVDAKKSGMEAVLGAGAGRSIGDLNDSFPDDKDDDDYDDDDDDYYDDDNDDDDDDAFDDDD